VKNKNETNEERIEALKANAVRALSNYMLANAAPKDPSLKARMKDFHGRSVQEAKGERDNRSLPTDEPS